ncbi:hypothetical protein F2Q69_00038174 [Brassica cretica]|uniref:Uncharacterized protein n=1 Tax=Brassica cretica TaxID=69181 RepID=A0A8S9SE79_BRACR|nr:hypothetical protein F2Q69_00038174 [Brassica cretica]
MENPPDQTESKEMMLQPRITRPKGGLLTMPFIIANEGFEKVASYGLLQNMILYLMSDYGLGLVKGQNVLFMWVAATNFMPLVGAFLSDSYLGRFLTISIASLSSFLGMMVLWLTAMLPQVKPSPCVASTVTKCSSTAATSSQLALLYFAFALISIGSGGIRPCSLAFGADQLDNKENPKNERVLESFFGWYYASSSVAVLIAFTVIVYIQDHLGWRIGFGVPAILMLPAGILFVLASPLYVKRNATKSLFTGLAQVAVAAYVNRKLMLPGQNDSYGCYYHLNDSELKAPSDKLSQGLANNANGIVNISAMWLVPQYVLHGLAEALTGIGQTEFFYTEFPKSMSSIAAALFGLGMAVANILASVILNVVKNSSKKGGESWIEDNINKGHYDYYYWVLAILSFVNVIYYIVCSWSYGPTMDQLRNDKANGVRGEEHEEAVKLN